MKWGGSVRRPRESGRFEDPHANDKGAGKVKCVRALLPTPGACASLSNAQPHQHSRTSTHDISTQHSAHTEPWANVVEVQPQPTTTRPSPQHVYARTHPHAAHNPNSQIS